MARRGRFCAEKEDVRRRNGGKGRGFAVGDPARRSRDGNGKTSAPVGPMTGPPGFAAGEMRPNGSKGRGASAGPHLSEAKMG